MHRSLVRLRFKEVDQINCTIKKNILTSNNFRFADDIELMTGQRPGLYWLICWKYLSPLAMISILVASFVEIATDGSSYQAWISATGQTEPRQWPIWAVLLIILWIPVVAICR
jgi:solute carrier family 6 (neurotransmitter transporter, amino acid/orphan) member 15/16/17/18/20